jgi:hypothetical protein
MGAASKAKTVSPTELRDLLAVDERAVGATQVPYEILVTLLADLGVLP